MKTFYVNEIESGLLHYQLNLTLNINPKNPDLLDDRLVNNMTRPLIHLFRKTPWDVLIREPNVDNVARYLMNIWSRCIGGDMRELVLYYARSGSTGRQLSTLDPFDTIWFNGVDNGWMPPTHEEHVKRWQAEKKAVALPYFQEVHDQLRKARRETADAINVLRKLSNAAHGGGSIVVD